MRFRYGLPVSPKRLLGKLALRLPHNLEDLPDTKKNKYEGVRWESLSKIWRMIMMDELAPPKNENDINESGKAKIVYGECSDTVTIEHALYRGLSVELIFGPKIRDAKSRKRLAYLKGKYGDNLLIYSAKERPPRHAVKIGENLLIEDYHPIDEDYRMSTSIQNASIRVVNRFNNYFEDIKNRASTKKLLTREDILKLNTLEISDFN